MPREAWSDAMGGQISIYRGSVKYKAKKMLHCLSCMAFAKDGSNSLQAIVKSALHIMFPAASVEKLMQAYISAEALPKPVILRRYKIVLDVTLLCLARGKEFIPMSRYLWVDSSLSVGHDWLWSQCILICDEQMLHIFEALIRLTAATQNYNGSAPLEEEVLEIMRSLHGKVQRHVYVPIAMAASHTSLSHKAKGIAHMMSLECRSWRSFQAHLQTVISVTSDLGTEASLATFQCTLKGIAPTWFCPCVEEVMEVDDGEFGSSTAGEDHHCAYKGSQLHKLQPLFGAAFQVPGVQHIVDNMSAEVHMAISYWSSFWVALKNCEALLSEPSRCRHFIWKCMRDSVWSHAIPQIEAFSYSLYEKRWHEIIRFCKGLQPLMGFLKACWDEIKYKEDRDDRAQQVFNPSLMTQTVSNARFASYLHLVIMLDQVPEAFASWAEGCDCHEGTHGQDAQE